MRDSRLAGVVLSVRPGTFSDVAVIYVADHFSNRVRAVTTDGLVTTLAGSWSGDPTRGAFADGVGTNAQFFHPWGIASDPYRPYGLLLCDTRNNRIRSIDALGVATTIAGGGVSGAPGSFADGVGSAARFASPYGIAVAGNVVYVADTVNNRIRTIDAAGTVTTVASDGRRADADGVGTAASFGGPFGIAGGPAMNGRPLLYVTELTNVIRAVAFASSSATPTASPSVSDTPSSSPTPDGTPSSSATAGSTPSRSRSLSRTPPASPSPAATPPPPPPTRILALALGGAVAGGAVALATVVAGAQALRRRAAPASAASSDARGDSSVNGGDYVELRAG